MTVGLIGSGIVVLWPEKRWLGWVFIGLGLLIAAFAVVWALARWHARKEFEREHSISPALPTQQLNQHASISPVIAPVFAPNFVQSQSQEQSQTQQVRSRFRNTRLDFECISAGFDDVEISPHSNEILPRASGQGIPGKAAIAEFRRNADEPAIDSINIRSQIGLHPADVNKASILIRQGRWLARDRDRMALDVGFRIQTTRRLAIAFVAIGKVMTYEGHYQRVRGFPRSVNVSEFVPEFQELTESKYDVEVHLFGTQQHGRNGR